MSDLRCDYFDKVIPVLATFEKIMIYKNVNSDELGEDRVLLNRAPLKGNID